MVDLLFKYININILKTDDMKDIIKTLFNNQRLKNLYLIELKYINSFREVNRYDDNYENIIKFAYEILPGFILNFGIYNIDYCEIDMNDAEGTFLKYTFRDLLNMMYNTRIKRKKLSEKLEYLTLKYIV